MSAYSQVYMNIDSRVLKEWIELSTLQHWLLNNTPFLLLILHFSPSVTHSRGRHKAEFSAFESTLNSSIISYRILFWGKWSGGLLCASSTC